MDSAGPTVISRRFLNIRSDADFSGFLDAAALDRVLMAFPTMEQGENWPHVLNGGAIFLLPVRCDSRGCYSLKEGEDAPQVNLLELACPDDDDWFPECETVAEQLATALN